jgi:hypothetical protein
MTETAATEPELHEVSALYDNLRITRSGRNSPTLECSCGRSFSADSWEEAGSDMDDHLDEALAAEGARS